jgi:hypothetical protein
MRCIVSRAFFYVVLFFFTTSYTFEIKNLNPELTWLEVGLSKFLLSGNEQKELHPLDLLKGVNIDSGRICIKNNTRDPIQVLQKIGEYIILRIRPNDALEIDAPIEISVATASSQQTGSSLQIIASSSNASEDDEQDLEPYFEDPHFEDPQLEKVPVIFSVRNFSENDIKVTCGDIGSKVYVGGVFEFEPNSIVLIHSPKYTYEVPEYLLWGILVSENYKRDVLRIYFSDDQIKFFAKNSRNDWSEVYEMSTSKALIVYPRNEILDTFYRRNI